MPETQKYANHITIQNLLTWANSRITRQRENDSYFSRELDYGTGLAMKQSTRPKR